MGNEMDLEGPHLLELSHRPFKKAALSGTALMCLRFSGRFLAECRLGTVSGHLGEGPQEREGGWGRKNKGLRININIY